MTGGARDERIEENGTAVPACDRCGRTAAAQAGDEHLCADCWHEAGSCCGGGPEEED